MTATPFTLRFPASGGPLAEAFEAALDELVEGRFVERLARREHGLWSDDPREITDRLGWVDAPETLAPDVDDLRQAAERAREDGFRRAVVLGMGGSSLGAETLARAFGATSADGGLDLLVLDSTVPSWVSAVAAAAPPADSLYLVASKSGTTLEVACLQAFFRQRAAEALDAKAASRLVAITDPDTRLAREATEQGYREVLLNPADVGGRYSVLTKFGLVPATLLGLDPGELLAGGRATRDACAEVPSSADEARRNPGLALGAFLAAGARRGRWLTTLLATERLDALELWTEQLVAESTGKGGAGILPIAGEPAAPVERYRDDRLFLAFLLAGDDPSDVLARVDALTAAGLPVAVLELSDPAGLAGVFYALEHATAVASHLLGIHPFDQPDVQAAKTRSGEVLEALQKSGSLPETRGHGPEALGTLLRDHPDAPYLALMAYAKAEPALEAAVSRLRRALLERHGLATTFGYAPRLLHSTGQLHKGGPPGGLFVQLLATGEEPLPIPGRSYTFRDLYQAQALGDAQALQEAGRPVLRVSLGPDPVTTVEELALAAQQR